MAKAISVPQPPPLELPELRATSGHHREIDGTTTSHSDAEWTHFHELIGHARDRLSPANTRKRSLGGSGVRSRRSRWGVMQDGEHTAGSRSLGAF